MAPQLHRDEYMLLWMCATLDELEAAENMLDEKHETPLCDNPLSDTFLHGGFPYDFSNHSCTYGRVSEHNVVIACLLKEKRNPVSVTTLEEQIKRAFTSLRFGLMVGIGGGVPSEKVDIRLGDVVVGTTHSETVLHNSYVGHPVMESIHTPPPVLLKAIANLQVEHMKGKRKLDEYLSKPDNLTHTYREYAGTDTLFAATYDHQGGATCRQCDKSYLVDREPRSQDLGVAVHYGKIVLCDQVLRSTIERDELSATIGGVLCFDTYMERLSYTFPCLVVRGICDYADSHKNTRWQRFAAATAAAYAKELLSVIPQAEVAHMITVDEAMQKLPDPSTISQGKKSSIRGLWGEWDVRESTRKCRNIKEFINEIAANHHDSFDSITWEWELPGSDMKNDVVLVCTSARNHAAGVFAHVHASTYWEYLKKSKWADFIMEILDISTRIEPGIGEAGIFEAVEAVLELANAETGFSMYAIKNPPVWITCTFWHLRIEFSNKRNFLEILDLVEVLDWLCNSMCGSTNKNEHIVVSASYSLPRDAAIRKYLYSLPGSSVTQPYWLQPCVRLKKSGLPEIKHSCWLSLFDSCVIVDSVSSSRGGFGKGLETSFDLMIALAASEFCLKINNSLVFLGYRTVLYPVAIDGNCAQFHLITTSHGQINPYTLNLENCLPVEDSSQFKTMRCFVGWCEDAHINLGTRNLAADIKYTGGRDHPKSLESDGYALLSQFGSSAPLSAIAGVQKNFKYSRHRIRFSPTENYLALLQDASQQPVVLYDSKQRRCWLVPKLSLLLHMSQRYTLCSAAGVIPYAEPHMDARDLIPILEPAGQTNVLGAQANPLQLQQLLFALNIRMLNTAEAMRESSRGKLYGFEFQDIIRSPDRGSCMKELKIQSKRKAWLELVNAVGTVIVCSGLGEVISVEGNSTRKCEKCNRVPENEDYFTATIPCLSQLAEQKGVELRIGTDGIKFSDKAFWKLETNPFMQCTHPANSNNTCWERPGFIQQMVDRRLLDWAPSPYSLLTSLLTSRPQPVQSQPVQSPLVKGAVVFG